LQAFLLLLIVFYLEISRDNSTSLIDFKSGRNMCAGRQDGVFGHHHDAIPDHPVRLVDLGTSGKRKDGRATANMGIFIDDGALDMAIRTDAERNTAYHRFFGTEKAIIVCTIKMLF
jgi:hypothetical protein